MKKKISVLATILILVLFFSCSNEPSRIQAPWLGTQINITVFDAISQADLEEAMSIVERIHKLFDPDDPESEVYSINQAAGKSAVAVSKELIEVSLVAQEISAISSGMFDLSIGPLVKLWGISTLNPRLPAMEEIEELLPFINWQDIEIDSTNSTIFLKKEGMELDFGGIAKGYSADRVKDFLSTRGVERAILDFGGNVYAMGEKSDGSAWRIGIQDPAAARNTYIGIYRVKNQSLVTSGVYERNFVEDGIFYHHILDPKTGYPSTNNIEAVTIIGPSSLWSDGLSTACFLLGKEKALQLIESLQNYEIIVVNNESQIIMSSGVEGNFVIK